MCTTNTTIPIPIVTQEWNTLLISTLNSHGPKHLLCMLQAYTQKHKITIPIDIHEISNKSLLYRAFRENYTDLFAWILRNTSVNTDINSATKFTNLVSQLFWQLEEFPTFEMIQILEQELRRRELEFTSDTVAICVALTGCQEKSDNVDSDIPCKEDISYMNYMLDSPLVIITNEVNQFLKILICFVLFFISYSKD